MFQKEAKEQIYEPCTFEFISNFHPLNTSNKTQYKTCKEELKTILDSIEKKREENILMNPEITKIKVQVIGGGTVGLIHAIKSYELGVNITLVEKTQKYNRDTWFDLYGNPWYKTLDIMNLWGFQNFPLNYIQHDEKVISIRSQILERYLLVNFLNLLEIYFKFL